MNPLQRIFFLCREFGLNLLITFQNRNWESPSSFLRHKRLKTKYIMEFLDGSFVSMVTYYVTSMSVSC